MKPGLDPASKNAQGHLFDRPGPALVDFIDLSNPLVRLADSSGGKYLKIIGEVRTVRGRWSDGQRRTIRCGLLMLKHSATSSPFG